MRYFILSILIGFPLAEAILLYHLAAGPNGHGGWVLAWCIFAAIAGVVLIKQARFSLLSRLTSAFSQGQFSLSAFIDSFRTVLAGLLLIFPGIISDVMALLLLMIPVREPVFEQGLNRHKNQRPRTSSGPTKTPPTDSQNSAGGGVIEGEFRRE